MSEISYRDITKNHTNAEIVSYALQKVKNIEHNLNLTIEGGSVAFTSGYALQEVKEVKVLLEELYKKYAGNDKGLVI